ncbi:ribokinase [Leeia oryzae]|uniref:ribokinase n=1 Tax=Leeia oryzae TaxID=356662 RepID=UPI0003774E08|nr:ribokinase [Leeia oryzae]
MQNPHAPILVIGSLNMDLVMRTPRVPQAGETLHGHDFSTHHGGKGANQAFACARLGGHVHMIGRVGKDDFGQRLKDGLSTVGANIDGIETVDAPTGVAMILVEDNGQNRILLSAGANGTYTPEDIDPLAPAIRQACLLVLQLEIPVPAIVRLLAIAKAAGTPVLLNPAPMAALPDNCWDAVTYLIPNETEASELTGIPVDSLDSASQAAKQLLARGVKQVLITLGSQGVWAAGAEANGHFPAQKVHAIDTTAAGDTFIGGIATGLQEGLSLTEAIQLGQAASAITVSRRGAQSAIPARHEVTSANQPG